MSKEYDDTNRGVLFQNTRTSNPNAPAYRGSLDVGGTRYWLSAWVADHPKYGEYFKLSLGDPLEEEEAPTKPVKRTIKHGS